ncbi:MAG: hypothetical protein ACRD38_00075 [Nitrososphaerales archaeon]
MLEQKDQELARIRRVLSKMDAIITTYKNELKEGRFRPRNGELWERTVEKQLVEVAITELQGLDEQESLEEMCRLVDEIEDFAEKARLVDV